jgi:hypothetical protein
MLGGVPDFAVAHPGYQHDHSLAAALLAFSLVIYKELTR